MTVLGTAHFPTFAAAVWYYKDYYGSPEATARVVRRKIAEQEIHIGKPTLKPGERLALIDNRLRYAIIEGDD